MAGIKKLAANLFQNPASKAGKPQASQKAVATQAAQKPPTSPAASQAQVPKHNLNQPALPEGSKKSWIA